ncbi:MAG: metallophosphoesterase family protein, partial [Polyangiales bacterium]
PTVTPDATLVGAGDIADCGLDDDSATAKLIDAIPGAVFTAGDNAYEDASVDDFMRCYQPTWGRHRDRTHPSPGNHEYATPRAGPYFAYFCAAAGTPFKGWYSYDVGTWHVVALNSNCEEFQSGIGCEAGSEQEQWLRADLAAHPAKCTLAYFHHPLFTSGKNGQSAYMRPIWQALYDANVDVVVSGHSHVYERFAPMNPNGELDPVRGIRELVVGTGGVKLSGFGDVQPGSEVRQADTHGVIKLTLHASSYDWEFVPVAGKSFRDAGTGSCH